MISLLSVVFSTIMSLLLVLLSLVLISKSLVVSVFVFSISDNLLDIELIFSLTLFNNLVREDNSSSERLLEIFSTFSITSFSSSLIVLMSSVIDCELEVELVFSSTLVSFDGEILLFSFFIFSVFLV